MANMARGSSSILISVLVLIVIVGVSSASAATLPVPEGRINDFGALVDPRTEERLAQQVLEYEVRFGGEIVIVTTTNRADRAYAKELFEYWRVGKPGLNNGILILLGDDGRAAMAVGSSLASIFSDFETRMITSDLSEQSKNGKPGVGLSEAVAEIAGTIAISRDERRTAPYNPPASARVAVVAFFASMTSLPWAAAVFGRARRGYSGTVMGILIAGLATLFAGPLIGAFLAVGLSAVGLLLDIFISRNYRVSQSTHRKPAWWAGGNWA